MTYDDWKLATPPEYDEPDSCKLCGSAVVELCLDGICIKCRDDIDRQEGDTMDEDINTNAPTDQAQIYSTAFNTLSHLDEHRIVALRSACTLELQKRHDFHSKIAEQTAHALGLDTKPAKTTKRRRAKKEETK